MAAWLRENLPGGQQRATVCLAAEDKAVIAAALLASLAGGPVLLLPYAFSGQALAGLQKTTGFTVAISDVEREFPAGTEVIRPKAGTSSPQLHNYTADPQKELLRLYTGGSTGVPQIWSKTGINIFAEALFLAGQTGQAHNQGPVPRTLIVTLPGIGGRRRRPGQRAGGDRTGGRAPVRRRRACRTGTSARFGS